MPRLSLGEANMRRALESQEFRLQRLIWVAWKPRDEIAVRGHSSPEILEPDFLFNAQVFYRVSANAPTQEPGF